MYFFGPFLIHLTGIIDSQIMLILRKGYFRTQWKAYSFGKVHSFWSWQPRELMSTSVLTTEHLSVFFYYFLPQLVAVQAIRSVKNNTVISEMPCFVLFLTILFTKGLAALVVVVVNYH